MTKQQKEIILYSRRICPYCNNAKIALKNKDLSYKEIIIDDDSAMLDEMIAKSNGRQTVPQIFIGDKHVGGYDELAVLIKNNKLDELL